MGFTHLTPENARATWVAGTVTFVLGGALTFIVGLVSIVLAALRLIAFAWEQAALTIIGALLVAIGLGTHRRVLRSHRQ